MTKGKKMQMHGRNEIMVKEKDTIQMEMFTVNNHCEDDDLFQSRSITNKSWNPRETNAFSACCDWFYFKISGITCIMTNRQAYG
jgi:hypothetical protein